MKRHALDEFGTLLMFRSAFYGFLFLVLFCDWWNVLIVSLFCLVRVKLFTLIVCRQTPISHMSIMENELNEHKRYYF